MHNPPRFQKQYYDKGAGLHYNRHRYYNPQIGSFISQDSTDCPTESVCIQL
ncbi:RHS repeat-associated core domain-containing protein [Mixta intestinalis]|uniref:RHS repeat-associated core domain-containing protein n=1 Tax=Mixta intestinalis TaxID=1615494 RepID=UPI001370E3A1